MYLENFILIIYCNRDVKGIYFPNISIKLGLRSLNIIIFSFFFTQFTQFILAYVSFNIKNIVLKNIVLKNQVLIKSDQLCFILLKFSIYNRYRK
jgi:hypothetical protein